MSYKNWLGNLLLSELPLQEKCPNFAQLVTDSREIKEGDWFFPLKGETYDGHNFIQEAINRGASGYFIQEGFPFESKVPSLRVANTMKAYHALASGWRSSLPSSFQLVALTGSVGKTTTKTMVSLMLSHFAKTFSTPGNQNTEFSIPKALFEIDSSYKYGVLEFGARHPGDIALLTHTAKPDVCVCINAASAHLEIFKDRGTILKTKLEIISESPRNSVAVALHDNSTLYENAKSFERKLFSFGYHPEASVSIRSETKLNEGMEIVFAIHGESHRLFLPLYHQSYPINAAAALAVGLALDLPAKKCVEGLSTFTGIKGRYRIVKTKSGQIVIDDSYNASPESMKAGLTSVLQSFYDKRKVLILGDMRELGDSSEEAHKSLAPYCIKLNPDRLITVGNFSNLIAAEAIKLGMNPKQLIHFATVEDLIKKIKDLSENMEVIYIKGSAAIQLSKAVEELVN